MIEGHASKMAELIGIMPALLSKIDKVAQMRLPHQLQTKGLWRWGFCLITILQLTVDGVWLIQEVDDY